MLHISVDNDSAWAIKTNGDVFVRTGVSSQTPRGTGWIKIKASSDLVQITSLSGLVWALDIYNHVQIFQGKNIWPFFVYYSYLNVKKLLARIRRDIWSLSYCNGIRTYNQFVRNRTLNHLAKLASSAKWLSVRLQTKCLWFRIPMQSSLLFIFILLLTEL